MHQFNPKNDFYPQKLVFLVTEKNCWFIGATGRAFLFSRAVNLFYSEIQERQMLTGRHMVRDVWCRNCSSKLGWIYEFATDDSQRYKEGRVILERALINEVETFKDAINSQLHSDSP